MPNKRLGQHWLHDASSLEAMLDVADIRPEDTVLEVGPGLGTLTDFLSAAAKEVVAVELDESLLEELRQRYQGGNVQVVAQNILDFDTAQLDDGYKLVANIPYYLTSKLIRTFSENPNPPRSMTLLVQKEVAERLSAEPGRLSVLGISAQFYHQIALHDVVPAHLFTPPPKVDSQIVHLERRKQPLFDIETKKFFKLIKAGFGEKRKTLRNSLSGGLQMTKADIESMLQAAGLPENARAQELTLKQWNELYSLLNEKGLL